MRSSHWMLRSEETALLSAPVTTLCGLSGLPKLPINTPCALCLFCALSPTPHCAADPFSRCASPFPKAPCVVVVSLLVPTHRFRKPHDRRRTKGAPRCNNNKSSSTMQGLSSSSHTDCCTPGGSSGRDRARRACGAHKIQILSNPLSPLRRRTTCRAAAAAPTATRRSRPPCRRRWRRPAPPRAPRRPVGFGG